MRTTRNRIVGLDARVRRGSRVGRDATRSTPVAIQPNATNQHQRHSYTTSKAVFEAIQTMRTDLPFPLLGLDSDNGSEFINDLLYHYCLSEKITFTRSRPYQKNDQAHVEQKYWSVVRRLVGYDRFETEAEYLLLQSIYADLPLNANFFQPVLKLVSKEYVDKKLVKRYDTAATPFQRILASKDIPLDAKARLTNLYVQLNPVQLRTSIDAKVAKLWKISR